MLMIIFLAFTFLQCFYTALTDTSAQVDPTGGIMQTSVLVIKEQGMSIFTKVPICIHTHTRGEAWRLMIQHMIDMIVIPQD